MRAELILSAGTKSATGSHVNTRACRVVGCPKRTSARHENIRTQKEPPKKVPYQTTRRCSIRIDCPIIVCEATGIPHMPRIGARLLSVCCCSSDCEYVGGEIDLIR